MKPKGIIQMSKQYVLAIRWTVHTLIISAIWNLDADVPHDHFNFCVVFFLNKYLCNNENHIK